MNEKRTFFEKKEISFSIPYFLFFISWFQLPPLFSIFHNKTSKFNIYHHFSCPYLSPNILKMDVFQSPFSFNVKGAPLELFPSKLNVINLLIKANFGRLTNLEFFIKINKSFAHLFRFFKSFYFLIFHYFVAKMIVFFSGRYKPFHLPDFIFETVYVKILHQLTIPALPQSVSYSSAFILLQIVYLFQILTAYLAILISWRFQSYFSFHHLHFTLHF